MSGLGIGFRCVCFVAGAFEKNNYDITITSGKINDEYSENNTFGFVVVVFGMLGLCLNGKSSAGDM